MASSFAWLDHSDRDRRRILDAIERFKETETRDELGLASLRDGFADLFFPGTSTIQTRARYFLFVPWTYQRIEARRTDRFAERLRKEEVALRNAMLESGEDVDGVIGKRRGAATKRLASSIYWLGLRRLQICLFPGSQEAFAVTATHRVKRDDAAVDDDGERVTRAGALAWNPHLPAPPPGFPEQASFTLTAAEATFLIERITFVAPESLFAHLAQHGEHVDCDFPWEHPELGSLTPTLRESLEHARMLAELMHGAALLYNLMLSEHLPEGKRRAERISLYEGELASWRQELGERERVIGAWDRPAFWRLAHSIAKVNPRTQRFVDGWLDLEPWRSGEATTGKSTARSLIQIRELQLKGKARARLGNPRALERWNGDAGTARLAFRWHSAQRILRDLYAGRDQEALDA